MSTKCTCTRRDFVRLSIGASSLAALPSFAFGQDTHAAKAKRMILLWMAGAPSQLDTFDLKPGNGSFKAIDTATADIKICEHLPRLAKQMKKVSLIRTVHSKDPNHPTASYLLHTGYRSAPDALHPHFASVLVNELGSKIDLPGCVVIGGNPPAGAGYLPAEVGPVVFDKLENPTEDIKLAKGVTVERLEDRWKLLRDFESPFLKSHEDSALEARTRGYERAYKVLTSERVKAFDITKEPDALRAKYGNSPFGNACLMARRLLEADVRFVEIILADWDTHADNFNGHKKLLDALDPGYAALLEDLEQKKMLDETLVCWMGEFGRTPGVNAAQGRDHFTKCWTVALAGGGIPGGRVVGETNAEGTDIKSRPVSVNDLFATIYAQFGINTRKEYRTQAKRPLKILDGGEPVKELF